MGLWEALLNWARGEGSNEILHLKAVDFDPFLLSSTFDPKDSHCLLRQTWSSSEEIMTALVSAGVFLPGQTMFFVLVAKGSRHEVVTSLFSKQEIELSLIGLQNAGKTSLVNFYTTGGYSEDMIPTVGCFMRKVTKGNVTIKFWDLGGQPQFHSMWERYCRAVSTIVYVVDAADLDNLSVSRSKLHELLSKPSLNGIRLLVLGNKIDKPGALSKQDLTDKMGLKSITGREVCCFMISCKKSTNIDTVINWLVKHSKSKN